jgi:1-aminocyclopropane-1-carboxylate deaminase/D-cysteine desulfhydrase-like pyridoxal-dependent ACC family enzyme
MNISTKTPIERHGGYWVKRDDLFEVAGAKGGKARTCWALAQGARGLVTAGTLASPQVNIVARIARELGVPCRAHVPTGALGPEVEAARAAGAEIIQHNPGRNSVIIKRARDDAAARVGDGWVEVPFGMECPEAVRQTASQVRDIPNDVQRIVVPVGSGMSLAGVLVGLEQLGRLLPVLGVVVGANPRKLLERYAAATAIERVRLVESGSNFRKRAQDTRLGDLDLDPIYEAKCLPFLRPGDLLWIIGHR